MSSVSKDRVEGDMPSVYNEHLSMTLKLSFQCTWCHIFGCWVVDAISTSSTVLVYLAVPPWELMCITEDKEQNFTIIVFNLIRRSVLMQSTLSKCAEVRHTSSPFTQLNVDA